MFRSVGRAGPVFVTAVRVVWYRGRSSTGRSLSKSPPTVTFLFAAHNRPAMSSSICAPDRSSQNHTYNFPERGFRGPWRSSASARGEYFNNYFRVADYSNMIIAFAMSSERSDNDYSLES